MASTFTLVLMKNLKKLAVLLIVSGALSSCGLPMALGRTVTNTVNAVGTSMNR